MSGNSIPSVIIAIVLGLMVLCIVPLITLEERVDNVVQQDVQRILESTAAEAANTGALTKEQYQSMESKLAATGKTYDIEITVYISDANLQGKKLAQANYTKIGENVYVAEYTTQVLSKIGIKTGSEKVTSTNNKMKLYPGNILALSATSKDSAAKDLKSNVFSFINSDENVVTASCSAMVTVNGTTDN